MTDFRPEPFGKYYLLDRVAVGGMAEIFRAKTFGHGGFENLVVIKRILGHLSENDDFVEMFIDEAKVSVALQHENIVRIYDFGKILENYYIAMECVDGKDVRAVLRSLAEDGRRLPVHFAAYIAHEACRGLDYAHRRTDAEGKPYHIVHRDISPSNLLVRYDGAVKVADFGIAKARSNVYHTKDGVLKGKFEYMSPEQVTGKVIDHRSDLFALGTILWEMSTGARLFKTDSDVATLDRIRNGTIDPPSSRNPAVTPELERVILRALAVDRDQRYQSAGEMQADLRALLGKSPDELREELGAFLEELFREEIAEEKRSLATGSVIAAKLRDQAPLEGWEGSTRSTIAPPPAKPRAMLPLLAGVFGAGSLVAALFAVGAAGLVYALWPESAPEAPKAEVPTTGALDIVVAPKARIAIDGLDMGETGALLLDDVKPGEHVIRFEADGYLAVEHRVTVIAGEAAKLPVTLTPQGASAPPVDAPPRPPPEASTPVVTFKSQPSGATVLIDGAAIGRTPLTWSDGSAGKTYAISYQLDGHAPATGQLSGLTGGGKRTFQLALEPVSAEPGALTVAIVGGGWANVWVDGEKLPKTAPLSGYKLPPGKHTLRVENEATGLNHEETITVSPGGTVTVRARP